MNLFFNFRNAGEFNYDLKLQDLEGSIRQVELTLQSYLEAKADQIVRKELGFIGGAFSSQKPILPSLLNLSVQAREVYQKAVLLDAQVKNDCQGNQGSLYRARLALHSPGLEKLIRMTTEALQEKQGKKEALGLIGLFCNADEGYISYDRGREFNSEIEKWKVLNPDVFRLSQTEDRGQHEEEGLKSLPMEDWLRGGGLLGGLALAARYPFKVFVTAAFLSTPFVFSSVRKHFSFSFIKADLTKTGMAAFGLTCLAIDRVQSAVKMLTKSKNLSDSMGSIEESIQDSAARKRLYVEVAKKATITSLSILALGGITYLYVKDELKMSNLGLNEMISSLNPIPHIEAVKNSIQEQAKEVLTSSSDFIGSRLDQVKALIFSAPDLLESGTKQLQDMLGDILTGL